LGMSRQEIDGLLDEIVAFAELEKFIDTQFKHYSSGMQSRLGFAVAANLRPEVLILDEVLSVGDILFQEKCMDRIGDMRKSGITVLYVSHNLYSIAQTCRRAMLLRQGHVVTVGEVGKVIEAYIPKLEKGRAYAQFSESPHPVAFDEAELVTEEGARCDEFEIDDDIWLRIRYTVRTQQRALGIQVRIRTKLEDIVSSSNIDDLGHLGVHPTGVFERRVRISRRFLKEGEYSIALAAGTLGRVGSGELYDSYDDVLRFSVVAGSLNTEHLSFRRDRPGKVILQGEWHDGDGSGNMKRLPVPPA